MKTEIKIDPAAVFAAALSLYDAGTNGAGIADSYDGMDGFMRACMATAEKFEGWACQRVNFDELTDVWPYKLEDEFAGAVTAGGFSLHELGTLDASAFERVAVRMNLPLIAEKQVEDMPVFEDNRE